MRFACYSVEGTSLSWWKRLLDEGNEVLVYVQKQDHREVGLGIVPCTNNYAEWVTWGNGGIYFFDCTDAGNKAESLRRSGQKVVGGGTFMDRLEKDRAWGAEMASAAGMASPKTRPFNTISEAIKFVGSHEGGYFFKPDKDIGTAATCGGDDSESVVRKLEVIKKMAGDSLPNIVQEKIKGADLSTARWWNGKAFTGPYEGTVEHKALFDGDVGPATGCSFNVLWFYESENPDIAQELKFDAVARLFVKHNAPPGIYDINAKLGKDGVAYFLEWTPRLGCDSEPTSQRGIGDLGLLLHTLAVGGEVGDLFSVGPVLGSVRLSVPPYPFNDYEIIPDKKSCKGQPIWNPDGLWSKHFVGYSLKYEDDQLVLADKSGLLGLSLGVGSNAAKAFDEVYDYIKEGGMDVSNLQYRTDAKACIQKDLQAILNLGYTIG